MNVFLYCFLKVSTYGHYPTEAFNSKPGDDTIESYTISYSNDKMETLFKRFIMELQIKLHFIIKI